MKKNFMVIRNPKVRLRIDNNSLIVKNKKSSSVISLEYIDSLYIYVGIRIELALLEKISRKIPLYLIDRYGYIKAKLVRVDEKA